LSRRRDADVVRAELEKQKSSIADIDKQLANCASAVAKGGVDVSAKRWCAGRPNCGSSGAGCWSIRNAPGRN
jgi:hypothetical protein